MAWLSSGCRRAAEHRAPVVAQKGVLDLREWQAEGAGVLRPYGEWEMYRRQLLFPSDFVAGRSPVWGFVTPTGVSTDKNGLFQESLGYVTYRLKILTGKQTDLVLYDINALYRFCIFIDGKLKKDNALTDTNNMHYLDLDNYSLAPSASHEVILQIVNDLPTDLGLHFSMKISSKETFIRDKLIETAVACTIIGMLLIMGIYHLILYISRRRDRSTLFFSLLCFAILFYQIIIAGDLSWLLKGQFDFYGTSWHYRFYTVTWLSCSALAVLYFRSLFPELYKKKTMLTFVTIFIIGASAALILPIPMVVRTIGALQLAFVAMGLNVFWLTVLAVRRHLPGARTYTIGTIVAFFCAFNDICTINGYIDTILIFPYGLAFYTLTQAVLLSQRFSYAFQQVDLLSTNLQKEVARQTSDLQSQKESLQQAHDQLQQADRQKTTFFQNISHELRTPLTLILGPLENLRELHGQDSEIEMALRNVKRLLRLVNQLLAFQKIAEDTSQMRLTPLKLVDFLRACGGYFTAACRHRGVDFQLQIEGEDEHVTIMAQIDALEKIVFNYLANALKYTPEGGCIVLGVTANTSHAKIWVKDTGPGIDVSGQQQLFKLFSQVEGAGISKNEGTGIGLALVKSLATKMGGEVGVKSGIGCGAEFFAAFPVAEKTDSAAASANQARDFHFQDWHLAGIEEAQKGGDEDGPSPGAISAGETGPLLLVVDDLVDIRHHLRNIFNANGYRVISAQNGAEGLTKAQMHHPDLIITDWMMPQMNGIDFIGKLRQIPELSHCPTILLTAKSDEESKLIGTHIGANAYVGKPFDKLEMLSTVKNLLALKKGEAQIRELHRQLTENVLKRFLPPQLVTDISQGHITMDFSPRLQTTTVMFSDLTGFTRMTHLLGAQRMARVLNEYFDVMSEVIFSHNGVVDKFIGDGIMAFFGAPTLLPAPEQAKLALDCARAMQRALQELNARLTTQGIPELIMRTSINQGQAVVGGFGGQRRMEYTAVGSMVNVAARIEAVTEPGNIYFPSSVKDHLDEGCFEAVGTFQLKGFKQEYQLFRLKTTA